MTKKVLVTGANGQLGKSILSQEAGNKDIEFTFVTRDSLDLSCSDSIEQYFQGNNFDVVINCAAYTAVDKAESEPELADKINHLAVKKLAEISREKNISFVQISTDYVFNGQNFKPYLETDDTDPQGVYGETKLKGELALQEINPNGIIIRTSWVYSEFGNNFVKTMLCLGKERDELSVIFDQVGTPTYAGDLAKAIIDIIEYPGFGQTSIKNSIYHYSNEGVASWYDFAKFIFDYCDVKCNVLPIETKDYRVAAMRPLYSLLNKDKVKLEFGLNIPWWIDSLMICLEKLKTKSC